VLSPAASLAFRSLLKSAASRARLDRPAARVTGLTSAATAFHAAALAVDTPVVLVVASDADVEQMTGDARLFLSAMQGWSVQDADERVLPFPSQEVDPYRGLSPHLQVASARARALYGLATGTARLVIASARALVPRLSDPSRLAAAGLTIAPGSEVSPQDLGERLALAGFSPGDPVDEHGEFCVRGGLVDFYPALAAQPVRLEFIGDIVESVRRYDAATQRSLAGLDQITITPQRELLDDPASPDDPGLADRSATFVDYARRAGALVVVVEADDVAERGRSVEAQWRSAENDMTARGRTVPPYESLGVPWDGLDTWLRSSNQVSELEVTSDAGSGTAIACVPALAYHGRIGDWADEIKRARERGDVTVFVAATPGRGERTIELLADYDIRARAIGESDDLARAAVLVTTGQLSHGFHLPAGNLLLFAETDLFEEERRAHERRRSATRSFVSDFRDLKVGDLVIHVDNGVGRFVGLKKLGVAPGQEPQEFMELRYAGEDKLFVRWSGSISSRNTRAAPIRRSTSSAARPGRKPSRV